MKTSIIVPVKDDDFIYTCLNSILKQFKNKIPKNREIIVVDDKNSQPSFSRKLKEFSKKNKIKYFKANKPGASFNRNKGMFVAKGRNILFIDSDCFPGKNWVQEMEKSFKKYDLVEGRITYASSEKPLFDRLVENKSTSFRFLTANLGMRKNVSKKCKFDERFIVFREDTDFGLCALEKGFKSTFNKKAEVFHKKSRFTIKRFIFERKRYMGEPLLFKKHKDNRLLKKHVPRIWRISHPLELVLLGFIFFSLFFSLKFFFLAYLFSGVIYSFKKYLLEKRTFKLKDTLLIFLLIPLTMVIKRISIWKGSIKFRVFLI